MQFSLFHYSLTKIWCHVYRAMPCIRRRMPKRYAKYGLFLLSCDSQVVWATTMGNECFMITIYIYMYMYIYICIYIYVYIIVQPFMISFSPKYFIADFFMIFGFCFGKWSFITVMVVLWKLQSPNWNAQVFWKLLWQFITIRSIQEDFSGFL